jgi:hypothetical protein
MDHGGGKRRAVIHAWSPRTNNKKPRPLPRGFRLRARASCSIQRSTEGDGSTLDRIPAETAVKRSFGFSIGRVLIHGRN